MKIEQDKWDRRIYIHFTDKCFMHFINDWSQLWGRWNWITAHILHIYFENESMTGGWEFEFVVLGLGFKFRYNYAFEESKAGRAIKEYEDDKYGFTITKTLTPIIPNFFDKLIEEKYKTDFKKMSKFIEKTKEFKEFKESDENWKIEVRPQVVIRNDNKLK